jgi:hypothetical protein
MPILVKSEYYDQCLRKKKNFERLLDENVATGMDRTIDGNHKSRTIVGSPCL